MSDRKTAKAKAVPSSQANEALAYEASSPGLASLRLIAAPNPKDDLSDAELKAMCKDPRHSPELIQQLIDFVKNM